MKKKIKPNQLSLFSKDERIAKVEDKIKQPCSCEEKTPVAKVISLREYNLNNEKNLIRELLATSKSF